MALPGEGMVAGNCVSDEGGIYNFTPMFSLRLGNSSHYSLLNGHRQMEKSVLNSQPDAPKHNPEGNSFLFSHWRMAGGN